MTPLHPISSALSTPSSTKERATTTIKAFPGRAGGVKKPSLSQTKLVVIILVVIMTGVVVVIAASLLIGPSLSVTKKNFTPYTTPVSGNHCYPYSLNILNKNGGVIVSTWSQDYLMINGTATASGFGSSPDVITFVESNSSRNIVFRPLFPNGTLLGVSYSVDIHVCEPVANPQVGFQFNTVQIVTVNGDIQISSVNTSSLTVTDTNGDINASNISAGITTAINTNGSIRLACIFPCGNATMISTNGIVTLDLSNVVYGGSYVMKTTNGNVNLKVPAGAALKITPNTTNGTCPRPGWESYSQITPQPQSGAESLMSA